MNRTCNCTKLEGVAGWSKKVMEQDGTTISSECHITNNLSIFLISWFLFIKQKFKDLPAN